jgi:hypothetical protein
LPTELIHAIPAAAAVPERMAVGSAQNTANADMIPAVANVSAATRRSPGMPGMALAAKPAATSRQGRLACTSSRMLFGE